MMKHLPAGCRKQNTVGLLLSGGIDSAVLLHWLLKSGHSVQPIYINSGLYWQTDELPSLRRYLADVSEPQIAPVIVLALPLDDVYDDHWSVTGRNVPTRFSPDQAVYLPCRAGLLLIKAILWCQLHGIEELALGNLKSNPFPDATNQFFDQFEAALDLALSSQLRILRPFASWNKRRVMEFGKDLPLERTFSCIAPVNEFHCGVCNKCAERQAAFRLVGRADLTVYAQEIISEFNGQTVKT